MGGHGLDSSGLAKKNSMMCMLHKRTDTHMFPVFQCGFKVHLAPQVMSHTSSMDLVSAGKEKRLHSFI